MKRIYILLLALYSLSTVTPGYGQEEFVGPLPGWCNVKVKYGAKGNGKEDDTKALQQALDDLSQPLIGYRMRKEERFMVLFLPAGTYNISSTLVLKGKIGVSIIGQDPAATIIRWTGPNTGTMLLATGTAYCKIARLTWNANNRPGIEAIGVHWKQRVTDKISQSSAPTSIEIADNIFTGNCSEGIGGGTSAGEGVGAMDSEISIRRCQFLSCAMAGIYITGFNALDYWIWDCQFIDCLDGINSKYGNYHVYRSYFRGSKQVDLHNTSGYYISARGCYSEGSRAFCYDEGYSTNPFKRIFQGNTILSPAITPIAYFSLTKMTFLDNKIGIARDSSIQSSVNTGSWGPGNYEVLSVNNMYSYKSPFRFTSQPSMVYTNEDKYGVAFKPIGSKAFLQTLDLMPKSTRRKILVIADGASTQKIQETINEAYKLKGQRPVIYFPSGKFYLDRPLIIPANADMQIVGDGQIDASILQASPSFPKGKALLSIMGPSQVVIQDIQIGQFTNVMSGIDAIAFDNADQPEGAAYIDQLYTNARRSIFGEGLDYLRIQETNSFFSDGKRITGGKLLQAGKGSAGLFCFGGQFAGLSVDNGAKAVMKDCWWEGDMRKPLLFNGIGNITIDGAMVAPRSADSNTTAAIGKFSGKICLANMYLQGGLEIQPDNPLLNLLIWNVHFYHKLNPLATVSAKANYKAAFMGITSQCFTADPKCNNIFTIANVFTGGAKADNFLSSMLAEDRSAIPARFTQRAAAISNVYISRISIGDCNTAIRFSK